jgi:DnaJ-domain-containing protein 1
MPPTDDIPGLGLRTDRPRLNTALSLAALKLTPTEGFVLSRIDGRANYDEICRMSSLGREETLAILRKLKRAAIILGPHDAVVAPVPSHKPPHSDKSPAAERSHKTPPPIMVTDEMLRKAQEKTDGKPEAAASEPGSLLERLDDGEVVPPADLIEGHDLPVETKRRIIRLCRRLRKLSAHELLGVPEDADQATIKRAFGAASKELHPDRYYGKDLGSFRAKLAKIFARLTEAVQEMQKARKAKSGKTGQ